MKCLDRLSSIQNILKGQTATALLKGQTATAWGDSTRTATALKGQTATAWGDSTRKGQARSLFPSLGAEGFSQRKGQTGSLLIPLAALLVCSGAGCSVRRYAINMVGDALASGNSVYESDEDLELVGGALPFGLKLMESLLAESPDHPGLLLTACQGFVLYSYAYVHYEAELAESKDLDRARALRNRARRLYLRGLRYGVRNLERSYPGIQQQLMIDPQQAVRHLQRKKRERDLPFLYWSAAALGLAISVSRDDTSMLARLPEVEALLSRGLELDEGWGGGSLHQFKVQLAGAKVGEPDWDAIRAHYERALELSGGTQAGLYVAYAEAVSIPNQNVEEFHSLLNQALAVDPDETPESRLVNLVAQRRARWLKDNVDTLILEQEDLEAEKGGGR